MTSVMEKIESNICRPEGTVEFIKTIPKEQLFNKRNPGGIIFKEVSGEQAFILNRDIDYKFNFYHFSPGTGTRVASIDVNDVEVSDKLHYFLEWSTKEIRLHIGAVGVEGAILHDAEGVISKSKIRIVNGDITWFGDEAVVKGTRIVQEGKMILEPTALDLWKETMQAIQILRDGFNDIDYLYKIIKNNMTIKTMVTGFEVYCKKRIVELQKEGIKPNMEALINKMFSQYERDQKNPEDMKQKAEDNGKTLLEAMADRKINFQSFDECKKTFSKAYDIKFGELGIESQNLAKIQQIIKFRHRLVHVSPILHIVNQMKLPKERPIFADDEYTEDAISIFDEFINILHSTTLELKRID